MACSRTKRSTSSENEHWNKGYRLALTNVELSRREALAILGTGALALLAYFSVVPSLSTEQAVTSSTDTESVESETTTDENENTYVTTTDEGGSSNGCGGDCSPGYGNPGDASPASMSVFATGTVDTAILNQRQAV